MAAGRWQSHLWDLNMTIRRRRRARQVLGMSWCIVCACTRIVEPPLDPRAVPLSPLPAVYARWWTMTEACSGLTASLGAVTWYFVPEAADVGVSGDLVSGYYTSGDNKIVLAGQSLLDGGTVRHEMLHALRRRPGHSRSDFLEHCAGFVHCSDKCIAVAGPLATLNPMITRVSAADLELDVRIVPEHPTTAEDGGVFTVIVTAKNPRADSVLIEGAPFPTQAFFYQLHGPGGESGSALPIVDGGVARFAAGETKQQLFDVRIGKSFPGFTILAGSYSVTGGYDFQSVTKQNVLIGP
jgi:hypothetical protein